MRARPLVFTLLSLLIAAAPVLAQSTSATVSGSVVDEQKAALPGATVTLRNVESGQSRSTAANERGGFQVAGLPPGRYELSAELSGFARLVRSDVTLTVAQAPPAAPPPRVAPVQEPATGPPQR